jgi:leucyl-tRNA synthetase
MKRYNPKELEPKVQAAWAKSGIYKTIEDPDKPKRYVLEYFPYPSGAAMHVGHVRNYTIGDAVARFYRMRGYNVMHPMGWDSFGLPAENYAIKNNISPAQAIKENTTKFKQQLIQMGFSYDWSREINSSDPKYYKWTQWFFKLLFEKGLAYQKDSLQWWCETDQTVLANEQVENGRCWRCGNPVVKKPLKQWFFKITDYADRLAEDLEGLDWDESIKSMQRNWIGKSIGAEVDFKISGSQKTIKVFTTRPDTLFGATFMVLAPEHPLASGLADKSQKDKVSKYIEQAETKTDIDRMETDREKTGVFTGSYAINPANNKKIPIWIADYVLMGYGTGAIMAVPAHDVRDYEFAQKFDLPITQVIMPSLIDESNPPREGKKDTFRHMTLAIVHDPKTDRYLTLRWKKVSWTSFITGGVEDGEDSVTAIKREIIEETGYTNFRLVRSLGLYEAFFFAAHKDVNRKVLGEHFLFELIDDTQKAVSEEEKAIHEVQWLSPEELKNAKIQHAEFAMDWERIKTGQDVFTGDGVMVNSKNYDGISSAEMRDKIVADLAKKGLGKERVNYRMRDWLISRQRYWGAPIPIIHCPDHGPVPVPDDQLPVELPEVKSYQPTGAGTSVLAGVKEWVNTTCPICHKPAKRETDTMDGFACSSWYFLRFADPHNDKAPFDKSKADFWLPVDDYIGGAEHAVMHLLYARMWAKVIFDSGMINFDEPFKALRNQGMILAPDGRKMSKSWDNTITPDEVIGQGYGADSVRLMELFIGPWNQDAAWSVEGLGGCFKFLQRVWAITQRYIEAGKPDDNGKSEGDIMVASHSAIKKVSSDLEDMGFNTAISALMEFVNKLYKIEAKNGFKPKKDWDFAIKTLLLLLSPFAPHITEELWHQIGNKESIHIAGWPVHDDGYLAKNTVKIAVQVNGKLRGEIEMPFDSGQPAVEEAARLHKNAAQHLSGDVRKVIYIPNKIINFVV